MIRIWEVMRSGMVAVWLIIILDRMLLQHIEEHGSTANKRFNVSSIVPIIKVSW